MIPQQHCRYQLATVSLSKLHTQKYKFDTFGFMEYHYGLFTYICMQDLVRRAMSSLSCTCVVSILHLCSSTLAVDYDTYSGDVVIYNDHYLLRVYAENCDILRITLEFDFTVRTLWRKQPMYVLVHENAERDPFWSHSPKIFVFKTVLCLMSSWSNRLAPC